MNGDGWVCDECGTTRVLASDRYASMGQGRPPAGWFVLIRSSGIPAATDDRWEFCSMACVHKQTTATECDNCGKPMADHGPLAECWREVHSDSSLPGGEA